MINVPLSDSDQPSTTPEGRKVDEYVALQTLYLLDRFGVSDEFYHELTQVIVSELFMHCTCACLCLCMCTDKV